MLPPEIAAHVLAPVGERCYPEGRLAVGDGCHTSDPRFIFCVHRFVEAISRHLSSLADGSPSFFAHLSSRIFFVCVLRRVHPSFCSSCVIHRFRLSFVISLLIINPRPSCSFCIELRQTREK